MKGTSASPGLVRVNPRPLAPLAVVVVEDVLAAVLVAEDGPGGAVGKLPGADRKSGLVTYYPTGTASKRKPR